LAALQVSSCLRNPREASSAFSGSGVVEDVGSNSAFHPAMHDFPYFAGQGQRRRGRGLK